MKEFKTLYVDASRIKSGGGIQHLNELLKSQDLFYFDEIIIFSYSELKNNLSKINNRIEFKTNLLINFNFFS